MLSVADLREVLREVLRRYPAKKPESVGWLGMSQAAKVANISRITLWRWVVDGVVPRKALLVVGKQTRISAAWAKGVVRG